VRWFPIGGRYSTLKQSEQSGQVEVLCNRAQHCDYAYHANSDEKQEQYWMVKLFDVQGLFTSLTLPLAVIDTIQED
jgi:hypothetical protein